MKRLPISPQTLLRALATAMVLSVGLGVAHSSTAQDRAQMARLLRESRDFRVRVQVAFAIGNTRDPIMRPHLERALRRDDNAAVRAAAATALGRLGTRRALPALRAALHDDDPRVRSEAEGSIERLSSRSSPPTSRPVARRSGRINWSRIRAALVVGAMRNQSGYRLPDARSRLREVVHSQLGRLTRVAVFEDPSSIDGRSRSEIRRRHVPTLRVDGTLTEVEPRRSRGGLSVRCAVSLMLLEEPGENIRGMLRGAATGTERRVRNARRMERQLAERAMSAAVRSAMSTADVAIARAARR